MWIGAVTMGNSTKVPQKIENRATMWSSNSTSGYLEKENENTNSYRYIEPHIHWSIIYNSQGMKTT